MLSEAQREYLLLSAKGLNRKEIAARTGESFYAVNNRGARLFQVLGVKSAPAAVAKAIALGQIENPFSQSWFALKVIEVVSTAYELTPEILSGKDRHGPIADARHVAIYLVKELTDLSPKRIGKLLGNLDRTSVKYAYEKLVMELSYDRAKAARIKQLQKLILSDQEEAVAA